MTNTDQIRVSNTDGRGGFLLVCEHASPHIPAAWGDLGLPEAARFEHIAWDPGAAGVARALSALLDAPLVEATVSRLVYDCNRPPDAASAMPARSEIWDIPGNAGLDAAARWQRTQQVYLPFQAALTGQLVKMLAHGQRPVLITIHSFTPVWHGQPRAVEFGVIHDTDAAYAERLVQLASASGRLASSLNQPYSARDGVTHTLRLHATPHDLPHAMLELRNDLLATDQAQSDIAAWLAPLLRQARGDHP